MNSEGLVTMARDVKDKRVVYVMLTPKGKDAFAAATPIAYDIMNKLMQGMGRNKARQFEKFLSTLRTNLLQLANSE